MSESIDSRKTYDKTFFRTIFNCTSRFLHRAGISENSDKWDTIISFWFCFYSVAFVRILWCSWMVQRPGNTVKDCWKKMCSFYIIFTYRCRLLSTKVSMIYWFYLKKHAPKENHSIFIGRSKFSYTIEYIMRDIKLCMYKSWHGTLVRNI